MTDDAENSCDTEKMAAGVKFNNLHSIRKETTTSFCRPTLDHIC